jgi:hypothetical protein
MAAASRCQLGSVPSAANRRLEQGRSSVVRVDCFHVPTEHLEGLAAAIVARCQVALPAGRGVVGGRPLGNRQVLLRPDQGLLGPAGRTKRIRDLLIDDRKVSLRIGAGRGRPRKPLEQRDALPIERERRFGIGPLDLDVAELGKRERKLSPRERRRRGAAGKFPPKRRCLAALLLRLRHPSLAEMQLADLLEKSGPPLSPLRAFRFGGGALLDEREALRESNERRFRIAILERGLSEAVVQIEARRLPLRLGRLDVRPRLENSPRLLERRARGARISARQKCRAHRDEIARLLEGRSRGRFRRRSSPNGQRPVARWRFSFPIDPQRERLHPTIGVADDLIEGALGAVTLRLRHGPGPDGCDCLPGRDGSGQGEHRRGGGENSLAFRLLARVIEAAHELGDRPIARLAVGVIERLGQAQPMALARHRRKDRIRGRRFDGAVEVQDHRDFAVSERDIDLALDPLRSERGGATDNDDLAALDDLAACFPS